MVQEIRTLGLSALLSFHTVARHGGISAAADRLGVAKSGVSRHVSQLEEHFGVRLLERGSRSVKLTPVGATLDQRIQSILAEVDLLSDIAKEESAAVSGHLNVAATPEFGGVIARELFPKVHAAHPGLTLSMRPAYEFEDMQDPGTDVAFRVGSFNDDRLIARELGSFRCSLVASPALAKQHPLSKPEDLANVPCLIFRGDRASTRWNLHGADHQIAVDVSGPYSVRSFFILHDLALAGLGYGFLPNFMVEKELSDGRLVHCLPDYTSRQFTVYLTFRPGARRIARVNAVIELAETHVPKLLSNEPRG